MACLFIECVDNAYACDPRIAQFKLEEKERKQAGKRAKQEAMKQKADEEERVRLLILFIILCWCITCRIIF
jgi:hypothetical protein